MKNGHPIPKDESSRAHGNSSTAAMTVTGPVSQFHGDLVKTFGQLDRLLIPDGGVKRFHVSGIQTAGHSTLTQRISLVNELGRSYLENTSGYLSSVHSPLKDETMSYVQRDQLAARGSACLEKVLAVLVMLPPNAESLLMLLVLEVLPWV